MDGAEPSGRRGGREGHGHEPTTPLLRNSHPHHQHHHQPSDAGGRAGAGAGDGDGRSMQLGQMVRRLIRSRVVGETATLRVEERHFNWGYSRPIVALDLAWNLAFALVAVSMLLTTARERPSVPIRVWIFGYALQCLLHVGFLFYEYRRRRRLRAWRRGRWVGEDEEEQELEGSREGRAVKKLDTLNAMVSLLWWILGFYWIVVGGQALLQDAPNLYWLAVVFLAFDVFFAIFCITLVCIVGIALFCCLPCIIALLYAVSGEEGASDADLSVLPKFRFRRVNLSENFDLEREQAVAVTITEPNTCDPVDGLELSPDDSECCICLSQYEDGVELHSLPCNHHFHAGCIVKWLRINATCPLCKYNILRGDEQV